MRTFAQKLKTTQATTSAKASIINRALVRQSHDPNSILDLQRTMENQSLLQFLQNNAANRNPLLTGTTSPHLRHSFSQTPFTAPRTCTMQTKLAINEPGDKYEQEADRIAEQVMHNTQLRPQHTCPCGGSCPKCQTQEAHPAHERMQIQRVRSRNMGRVTVPVAGEVLRQNISAKAVEKVAIQAKSSLPSAGCERDVGYHLENRTNRNRGSGNPLSHASRSFFEARMGHDFSKVRVHTGRQATDAARALNARAFTVGNDVVFGAGEYKPNTLTGNRLLAHELTHVVQQRNGGQRIQRAVQAIAIPIVGVTISVAALIDAMILLLSAILATYALIRAYEFAQERGFGVSLAQQALASSLGRITTAGIELVALIEAVLEAARRTTNPSDPCRTAIRGLEFALRDIISILGDIRRMSSADTVIVANIRGQCRLLAGTIETLWRIIQNVFNLCELAPREVSDTAVRLSRSAIEGALHRIRDFFGSWGIQ